MSLVSPSTTKRENRSEAALTKIHLIQATGRNLQFEKDTQKTTSAGIGGVKHNNKNETKTSIHERGD